VPDSVFSVLSAYRPNGDLLHGLICEDGLAAFTEIAISDLLQATGRSFGHPIKMDISSPRGLHSGRK